MKKILTNTLTVTASSTLVAALLLSGCSSSSTEETSSSTSGSANSSDAGDSLKIYATTGYLADAVKNIAPDADIVTMVGPGGDPHTYQPSTKDVQTIMNADLVVWNGLHLEARMLDLLEGLEGKQINVGSKLPENMLLDWPEVGENGEKLHDPHIWNSPEAWQKVVNEVATAISEVDKEHASEYKANADKYDEEIKKTAAAAKAKLDAVPESDRILISGHDAFNYFGKTFGYEVHATDFVSSEAQLSPEQLSELAELISTKKVPVIFLDNQANPQAIKSLQEAVKSRGWDVKISDEELFADSLGEGQDVDTYLEVLEHNADAVSSALGKSE